MNTAAFCKTVETFTPSARTQPRHYFTSPELFALEQEKIFSQSLDVRFSATGISTAAPNRQDWKVCELSQAGISSRACCPGMYSPRESIPAAGDRECLRALGKVTFPRS